MDAQLDLIMYHGFMTDGADNRQHLAMTKAVPELATLTVVEDANYSSLTQFHVREDAVRDEYVRRNNTRIHQCA